MTDETGEKPDRTPKDKGLRTDPRATPETPAGAAGLTYDGHTIPAGEMRDAGEVDQTEAYQRLAAAQLTDRETLLAQLAGAQRKGVDHRPSVMTKGDIHATEWARLTRLYKRLDARAQQRLGFSVLAYSLYRLLGELTKKGVVETEYVLNGVMTPLGWGDENVAAFNTAVAIVWSMAGQKDHAVTSDMNQALRSLFAELDLSEDEVMGK